MLNVVWVGLIVIGVVTAAATGRLDTGVTRAAFDSAKLGVESVIAMTGILIFWLGIARVAEASGLIESLAGLLRPIFRHIFPSLDPRGPALRAILLNVAANVLGLGQAATPFGLRAMKELQACSREEDPTVASDAMVTLLVMNTAGVTLIPATVIAYRAAAGSHDPAQIVPATICASFGSTILALALDALLRRRRRT